MSNLCGKFYCLLFPSKKPRSPVVEWPLEISIVTKGLVKSIQTDSWEYCENGSCTSIKYQNTTISFSKPTEFQRKKGDRIMTVHTNLPFVSLNWMEMNLLWEAIQVKFPTNYYTQKKMDAEKKYLENLARLEHFKQLGQGE